MSPANRNIRKKCTGPCGRRRQANITYFHRDPTQPDGLRKECKECRNAKERKKRQKRYQVNVEKEREANQFYYLKRLLKEQDQEGGDGDAKDVD